MHDLDQLEQELREEYPLPSAVATERARAEVARTVKGQAPPRRPRRRRLVALAVAVAVISGASALAWVAFHGGAAAAQGPRIVRALNVALTVSTTTPAPDCPARTGTDAYDTTITPRSGPPGSTVTVSGPLPVISEDGTDVGQTASEVDVYWNLDFDKWWSVLGNSPSPLASVAGSPVKFLGSQDVSKLCAYQVQVTVPAVPPGTYPIEVLDQGPDVGGPSFASFAPTDFQVVAG